MSTQAEQEDEVQAVAGQNWREILLYLYNNEIIIDAHGHEPWISPNADVVEETGIDPEQVVAELQYLDTEDLVKYTYLEVEDASETFIVYRLTADGFKIAQERTEAARLHHQQEKQIEVNKQLFFATVILAITGSMQATTSILSAEQPYQGILLAGFLLLLIFLGILVTWRNGM